MSQRLLVTADSGVMNFKQGDNLKILMMFISMIFLVGCGDNDNPSSSQEILSEIKGAWISNCYELFYGEGLTSIYALEEYTFNNESYNWKIIQYDDDDCTSPCGVVDEYFGGIEFIAELNTTDEKIVNHISLELDSNDWPDNYEPYTLDKIIYIDEEILYFGYYSE